MPKSLRCPVCGKPLTQQEYDKALGLWERKQEHIEHLKEEQRMLREQQKRDQQMLRTERQKIEKQSLQFDREKRRLQLEAKKQVTLAAEKRKQALERQRVSLQRSFKSKIETRVKEGVEKGITENKAQLKKQLDEIAKTKNKMDQLERSLQLSVRKSEKATEEIKRLKEQIEKGITPQIEGLLEEGILLAKLQQLFPHDKFEHPGKKGDIIQLVIAQGREVGRILYECKKVKQFDKKHVEQARAARSARKADYAVLVTNAFPAKKQYYFVEKEVLVISPVSLEPIVITLRGSLIRVALLRLSTQAKQRAVQQVYDYLSSAQYSNKINDMTDQLLDLARQLKSEMKAHKGLWERRYTTYQDLFTDVSNIDHNLRLLLQGATGKPRKALPAPKRKYPEIAGL